MYICHAAKCSIEPFYFALLHFFDSTGMKLGQNGEVNVNLTEKHVEINDIH